MDEALQKVINNMIDEVKAKEDELMKNPLFEEIKQKKKLVNQLSQTYGGDTIYKDIESESIIGKGIKITPGKFKGWSLSKAARWYIEERGKENPPTYDEIIDTLKQGDWDGKVSDVKTTLLKNNQISLLKGSGEQRFGLTEWYYKKSRKSKGDNEDEIEEGDESSDENKTEEETTEDTNS